MATLFPSLFRANVQINGAAGVLVDQSLGVGISSTQLGALGAGNAAVGARLAVGRGFVDSTNHLHVGGNAGVTGHATVGTSLSVGTDATVGADLDVIADTTVGSKLAVGTSAVHATNDLHVVGNTGVTVDLAVGEDATVAGSVIAGAAPASVIGLTAGDVVGVRVLAGAADVALAADNAMYALGDVHFSNDLYLDGDLIMTGGLQLPQLGSEIINIVNSQIAGAAGGAAMTGGRIPTSGMLTVHVASNNADVAPSAVFMASKPDVSVAGVVSRIHSGPAAVRTATGLAVLDLVWNAGATAKPAIFYETNSTASGTFCHYGVSTMIASGPTVNELV